MTYVILGRYNGQTEEVDSFDEKGEAERCLGEYRMAYGAGWSLWLEERENA